MTNPPVTKRIRLPNDDYEIRKFTDLGNVRTTGHGSPIIELEYDANENLIKVEEYRASREITAIVTSADVSGSLNNKAITIYSAGDATQYYIWFNVGGAGVDPGHTGTPIPVAFATNSTSETIKNAIITELNTNFSSSFIAISKGTSEIKVETLDFLNTTATSDIDSGFSIVQKRAGLTRELISTTHLTYDANDNLTEVKRLEHTR